LQLRLLLDLFIAFRVHQFVVLNAQCLTITCLLRLRLYQDE